MSRSHALRYEWGEAPDPAEVGAAVREAGLELVLCQQSDTSTGVVADVRGDEGGRRRCDARRRRDLVTRRGARSRRTPGGSTSSLSGSQKALMCPPGPRDGLGARARACPRDALAQLLLRLACEQGGAGQARRRVHSGGLADPEPRRRARDDPRRRARGGVRAASFGSAARPEPASRRWGSSSSRPTTTRRRS